MKRVIIAVFISVFAFAILPAGAAPQSDTSAHPGFMKVAAADTAKAKPAAKKEVKKAKKAAKKAAKAKAKAGAKKDAKK